MLARLALWKNGIAARTAAVVISIAALPGAVCLFRASRLWGLPDIGEPFDVQAFQQIDVDPGENAWTAYSAAESLLTEEGRSATPRRSGVSLLELSWDAVSAEDRAWLEANRPALERWRAGTGKPVAMRVSPRAISLNNAVGGVQVGTTWATLSKLESLRLESSGNLDAAWTWHRAFYRYSRHRGCLDSEVERLVGIAFHSLATQRIAAWSDSPDVTEAQLKRAQEQVRDDFRLTETLSNTIRIEYLLAIREAELSLEDYDRWEEFPDVFGNTLPKPPTALGRLISNEPEVTRRLLNCQVANLLDNVEKPREEWPQSVRSRVSFFVVPSNADPLLIGEAEFVERVRASPLAQLCLLNVLSHGSPVREQAAQSLLEVILAAQRHRRLHDEFPESIDQLVESGLLPVAPVDPRDRNCGPLRYRRDEEDRNQAVVWSVGDNRVDDGGNIALGQGHDPLDQGYSLGGAGTIE
jgi:hypothetical protein